MSRKRHLPSECSRARGARELIDGRKELSRTGWHLPLFAVRPARTRLSSLPRVRPEGSASRLLPREADGEVERAWKLVAPRNGQGFGFGRRSGRCFENPRAAIASEYGTTARVGGRAGDVEAKEGSAGVDTRNRLRSRITRDGGVVGSGGPIDLPEGRRRERATTGGLSEGGSGKKNWRLSSAHRVASGGIAREPLLVENWRSRIESRPARGPPWPARPMAFPPSASKCARPLFAPSPVLVKRCTCRVAGRRIGGSADRQTADRQTRMERQSGRAAERQSGRTGRPAGRLPGTTGARTRPLRVVCIWGWLPA
ncbi:hypothetical protein KM043_006127 [Ampulex compressa]|nr:hypothetical protein KM043_006127 [Ampulex compressa]